MIYYYQQNNNGFIALISIIIISTILFVTTLSIAQFGIAGRYFILDLEQKTASYELAEACVEIARIKIYNDSHYQENSTQKITINTETCSIESALINGGRTTVQITGRKHNAVTHLQILFDNQTANYLEWIEVIHF